MKNIKILFTICTISLSIFAAGCNSAVEPPVSNVKQETETESNDESLSRVFYSAPDGTIIGIAVAEGLDMGKSDIDKGNISGSTFFSGTYQGDEITVGYVEKEDADILENIEDIYSDSGEDIGDVIGTRVREGISEMTSQLYIKAPDEEEEDAYLPISLAYTDTDEGYVYVVMMDKRFAGSGFGIDALTDILSVDYSGYYKKPEDFLKNYIKIGNR